MRRCKMSMAVWFAQWISTIVRDIRCCATVLRWIMLTPHRARVNAPHPSPALKSMNRRIQMKKAAIRSLFHVLRYPARQGDFFTPDVSESSVFVPPFFVFGVFLFFLFFFF